MVKTKKSAPKNKKLIYIHKDVLPLLAEEKNASKLINELLKAHYTKAAINQEDVHTVVGMVNRVHGIISDETFGDFYVEPGTVTDTQLPAQVTKSETPPLSIDGRIDETETTKVDGRIAGGDQTDGAVWN